MSWVQKWADEKNNKVVLHTGNLRHVLQESPAMMLKIAQQEIADPQSPFYKKHNLIDLTDELKPSFVADFALYLVVNDKFTLKQNKLNDYTTRVELDKAKKLPLDKIGESRFYEQFMQQAGLASVNPGVPR